MRVIIDQRDFCLRRGLLASETAADGLSRCAKVSMRARKGFAGRASCTLLVESIADARSASVFSGEIRHVYTLARLSQLGHVEGSFEKIRDLMKRSAEALGESLPF
ncbi:MAG: hypothetical protein AB1324_00185 [Candidatus Micrarchaeota archaeon]